MGRILGIDYGEKRLGLAISDETHTIASGLEVYERRSPERDLQHLKEVVERYGVERVVLGLPLNLDGSQGFKAREALAFKVQLESALDVPVGPQPPSAQGGARSTGRRVDPAALSGRATARPV